MIALVRALKMLGCALLLLLGVHLAGTGEEWTTEKIRTVVLTDVYEYVDKDNNIKARGKFIDQAIHTTFQYPITYKLYNDFRAAGYKNTEMAVSLTRKDVGDPSYPKMQAEYIPGFIFVFAGGYFLWEGFALAMFGNKKRPKVIVIDEEEDVLK